MVKVKKKRKKIKKKSNPFKSVEVLKEAGEKKKERPKTLIHGCTFHQPGPSDEFKNLVLAHMDIAEAHVKLVDKTMGLTDATSLTAAGDGDTTISNCTFMGKVVVGEKS